MTLQYALAHIEIDTERNVQARAAAPIGIGGRDQCRIQVGIGAVNVSPDFAVKTNKRASQSVARQLPLADR